MQNIKSPKKLIEVALPLDDINNAAGKEKSIRQGHPSSLHLWWARRPLSAARAVIFSQMVNDPGYERSLGRGVNKDKAKIEREQLFGLIRRLASWDNTNDVQLLEEARAEILKSWRETCELNRGHPEAAELFNPERLPAFHDPFAGGGALPLEAQRLGLESFATDLNPVAVLINKAMIEIPPRFASRPPVGPIPSSVKQSAFPTDWNGARGLAEDVRRYGRWMRDEAFKRIGRHYPEVDLGKEHGGGKATVLAWLWARTVKSPNPAFSHVDVPLVSSFILANRAGKEAYVDPVVDADTYQFVVRSGKPPETAKSGTKMGKAKDFFCLVSKSPIAREYIRAEGKAGRIGMKLMAIVAEGPKGRIYLSPVDSIEQVAIAAAGEPIVDEARSTFLSGSTPTRAMITGGVCSAYGLTTWGHMFTPRQIVGLTTFSDLVLELRERIKADGVASGWPEDSRSLDDGGVGPAAYADAISIFMAFCLDKMADLGNSLVRWEPTAQCPRQLFGRQGFPMLWDFAEANPFCDSSGSWEVFIDGVAKAMDKVFAITPSWFVGHAAQQDAQTQSVSLRKVVSTDPPYYDNIGYADLSDFFYVWLRRALRPVFPALFSTMLVPKAEELVATVYRHGSKQAAEKFFLDGMTEAMHRLAEQAHPAFPTTIYYAFKQAETTDVGTSSTGWETFLEAVLAAGFAITGTWPLRTENDSRMVSQGTNALASSILLVCRQRSASAETISRRDFLRELKDELKEAVDVMIGGAEGISPVAPVDLAQAVIGPGMAIFSKYSAVLEADGRPMTVHTALTLINRMLTEGADDFDADTQFCLGWFDELGWTAGEFGKATVLARAKGTSVDHVRDAGVVEAISGRVRLLKPSEYSEEWSPEHDNNTPVWEALHQLIHALRANGEADAGALLAGMPQRAEPIRNLAYRLYTLCERKGWAEDARAYNELITSWAGIESASHEKGHLGSQAKFDI
jgi:putative DNA methylase